MDGSSCEFALSNATPEEIGTILASTRTVAVVGLSDKPDRESFIVARYLQAHGFHIIPINPAVREVLGETSYPDLASVPAGVEIDVVDIFRRPEFIPEIVEAAIARGARVVWMQLGLAHNGAADRARAAGLQVVMDRCIKVEHARLAAAGR
ncbi:MAG: CoA-binding protein [Acidobacteriota bacterium]